MCGIFGLFLNRPLLTDDIELARRSTDSLAHRGPDGMGEYSAPGDGVHFGHRRLKIIDLSERSHQPMLRNNIVLTYNGEIYNFLTLKNRLEGLGHQFSSSGDTEVLLKAWHQWGPACLDELDGMFAFALWDGQHGWLAVDPFSEKQLYYADTENGILFSSELSVLAEATKANANIKCNLPAFLTLGYIPSPNTIYPRIKRLNPGSWIKIEKGRIIEENRYWSPVIPTEHTRDRPKFDASALDRVHEILVENVSTRMISDVPVCLFLSSGVDSTLIAAIAKNDLNRDIEAITISYPTGDTNNESAAAKEIAHLLDIPHKVVANVDASGIPTPSSLTKLFGQPNGNITITSVLQMANSAKTQNYRVGLTGLGGDELFFGYGKQDFAYRRRLLYNLPQSIRLALGQFAGLAAPFWNSALIFKAYLGVKDNERIPALKMPWMIDALRQIPGFANWSCERYRYSGQPFEYSISQIEMMETMVNSQLPALDLGSMHASMEFRTPFLSRKLSDFMANWDWGDTMSRGQKWILKDLLARYLPREMIDRKKIGFIFPVDQFLDQFQTPPRNFPFLPKSLQDEIWNQRRQPNWRSLAARTLLVSQFYEEIKSDGRLDSDR
jgi:asparagine synthase (glutamine-hydrolysing)